ncbi:hypothetical protein [Ferviditalea candida]|uniref:Uncharacterized protein n=1 Tax=Ferviditalea candida TaxID=3108399 RepID=A0ABU5ZNE3_9BACL|nr:hypothetical protein [Paenibacillaceae bacterium T2]
MEKWIKKMESVVFGQEQNIRFLLTALLAGGHVLLDRGRESRY